MDFTNLYIQDTFQKVIHIGSGSYLYDGTGSFVSPIISGSMSIVGDVIINSGSVYVDGNQLGVTASYALNVDRTLLMDSASYSLTASYAENISIETWNNIEGKPDGIVSSSTQIDYTDIQNQPILIDSASYALNVDRTLLMQSSSHSLLAETASYFNLPPNILSGSVSYLDLTDIPANIVSGSLIDSASYALDVDRSLLMNSSSYVTDPFIAYQNQTNFFTGSQYISGSVTVSDSIRASTGISGMSAFSRGLTVNNLSGDASIDNFIVNSNNYTAITVSASEDSVQLLDNSAGKIGFLGATPTTQSAGWDITNVIATKIYDSDITNIDEISLVLGTLINELKLKGLIG